MVQNFPDYCPKVYCHTGDNLYRQKNGNEDPPPRPLGVNPTQESTTKIFGFKFKFYSIFGSRLYPKMIACHCSCISRSALHWQTKMRLKPHYPLILESKPSLNPRPPTSWWGAGVPFDQNRQKLRPTHPPARHFAPLRYALDPGTWWWWAWELCGLAIPIHTVTMCPQS